MVDWSNWEFDGMEIPMDNATAGQVNYIGAIIFWVYIASALFFTALIIHTLLDIEPSKAPGGQRQQTGVILFSGLAAISFAALSINMLNVLIQSFEAWSQQHERFLQHSLVGAVWKWSLTSTLFHDFGEAVVENSARYLWSEAALISTFAVCLFMRIQGARRQVPCLWAFFCLMQILPTSFTQNLFYVALLRLRNNPLPERIQVPVLGHLIYITGAYCVTLLILPMTARSAWLMPCVLVSRILLFAPLFAITSEPRQTPQKELIYSEIKKEWIPTSIALLASVCIIFQIFVGLQNVNVMGWALFEHPAVSSLGCDMIISLISAAIWIGYSGNPGKILRGRRKMT